MTPNDRHLWIDLTAARYLEAVEANDFDAQTELWALAAADAELEAAFREIHVGLLEEVQASAAAVIGAAVAKHLTSGEVVRPAGGVVTVADVANELFRHTPERLPAESHVLNERLRQATDELPTELGLLQLTDWMVAKFGPVPAEYLKAFRHAANKVRMRASPEAGYQLAARRTKPAGGAT